MKTNRKKIPIYTSFKEALAINTYVWVYRAE